MTYLTILEKLQILLNMLLDFKVVLIFSILLIILTILYLVKVLNKKKYTLSMLISFILVFGISIISNYKILSGTFDNFSTIFFGNIYFPSIYVYIASLVLVLITFITSMLNKMLKKIYKVINTLAFVISNVLLVIILNIIAKSKIDIFSISSLYTNTNLVAMLEISMTLLIIWILSLVVIYATNCICERLSVKKTAVNTIEEIVEEVIPEEVEDESTIKSNDVVVEVIEEVIPEKDIIINEITTEEVEETSEDLVVETNDNISFNDILNGGIEAVYYDNNTDNIEYNIIDPQEMYEKKYELAKEDNLNINNITHDIEEKTTEVSIIEPEVIIKKSSELEKEQLVKERLETNTVLLNELNEKEEIVEINDNTSMNDIVSEVVKDTYTIEDYKMMVKMLSDLKNHSHKSNISIDDAVTISLISNYSIEDCIKFKEILENNLN